MPENINGFTYIDLFAGCGGLSLGLESEGGKLKVAVERSPMAAETFYRNLVEPYISSEEWKNFARLDPLDQAEKGLIINDITSSATYDAITSVLKTADVDLVAGGPPCQGFSLAGRRNKDDRRNSLAWDFLKYVEIASPKFVLIENVLGMNAKFKSQEENSDSAYNQVAVALSEAGSEYIVQKLHLNSMHFGAAQTRERLFLVGCRKDVAQELGLIVTEGVWKSNFADLVSDIPDLAPKPTINSGSAVTTEQALGGLISGGHDSSYVSNLKDAKSWGLIKRTGTHNQIKRHHRPETILKFEVYIALKSLGLSPKLMKNGLSDKDEDSRNKLREELQVLDIYPIRKTTGAILAETFEEFDNLLEKFKTKKHSQRVLELKKTPPTVITSPDDYLHPAEPRVLTVRELARFQGFSDHFIFHAKETTGGLKRRTEVPQYSQVGNAVSPFVSRAFGRLFSSLLGTP